MQASDGNVYGTTTAGGANGFGTVFALYGFPPAIYQQPTNQSFALAGTALFSVGATGSLPLSYLWYMNGNPLSDSRNIAGATNSQLTVSPERLTNAGSYSVVVTNSFGSVTSAVAVLTSPIPTLTIKAPGASVTSPSLTVQGPASGAYGVVYVQYRLNGGTWGLAGSTNQWANWSALVTLQPGTNIFQAYCLDPAGQYSQTNSVTNFYVTQSPLTLLTNGSGGISRSFSGTNLVVGTNYTVKAVPNPGNLFSNWTGLKPGGPFTATNNPLTFLMASNMTLTANFVTNSFLRAVGTYNGLFYDTNEVGAQSSGLLGGLKVGPLGIYSGKLYIGGTNYVVSGNFDLSGYASNQIARPAGLGALSLVMSLDWDATPPQITGTVQGTNGGAWTAELTNQLAGSNLPSAQYTLLIPPGPDAPANSPAGYGYALISNHLGNVTVTGALADGAGFSQSIAESTNRLLAIYAAPYTNGLLTNGLLLGWLDLSGGAPAGSLTWIRPAEAGGLFPGGYTNDVTVQSSAWTNLSTLGTNATLLLNEQLDISGAFLAAPLIFDVNLIYTNNDLAVTSGPTNSLSSKINPKTGLLKITFGNGNGAKTTAATGVILQNHALGGGYFVTSTNTGSFSLHP
jgi:hypothetical protein